MIKQLQINNFRNYENVKVIIPFDKNVVVLYGANGHGKTNILEAISLLSGSNGLRRAKYEEIINRNTRKNYWSITVKTENSVFTSGYIKNENSGRRIYKIENESVKNFSEFLKERSILWMTYENDRLFLESPANRRAFVDMFCIATSRFHADNLRNYEKLAKERLKILKQFTGNRNHDTSKWLDIIENKIADFGIKIANDRMKMVEELEHRQPQNREFPKFQNKMVGPIEQFSFSQNSTLNQEDYKIELTNRREKDSLIGATTFGPNRSDWKVLHTEKQMAAEFCSAGEQKMLLSSIFFSFVIKSIQNDSRKLILLLDDAITHLDANHRALFFKYIKELVTKNTTRVSVWSSGTDKNIFEELSDIALFLNVHNGEINLCHE
jgi:DNA replication and repair protein RecF